MQELLDSGRKCCILELGRWTLDSRCWITEPGFWTVDSGLWMLKLENFNLPKALKVMEIY